MTTQTKNELLDELDALKDALAAKEEELSRKEAELQSLSTGRDSTGGYLITTPNESYSGKTFNVKFLDGLAFVESLPPVTRKDGTTDFRNEAVQVLVTDFGYSWEYLTAGEVEERRSGNESLDDSASDSYVERLSQPHVMGA